MTVLEKRSLGALLLWVLAGGYSVLALAETPGEDSVKQDASLSNSSKSDTGRQESAVEAPRYYNPPPLTTGYIRPIDYGLGEPATGIKKGPVTLHPLFFTALTYNDNVLGNISSREKNDFIWDISPGYELVYKPQRDFTLKQSYKFGWVDYLDDTAKDYLTHDAALNLQWRNLGFKGLTLDFDEQYSQSGNTGVFENQFVSFSRVQGNSVGPTVSWENRKMGFVAGYRFGLTDYFSHPNQVNDYHTHTVPALYFYNLTSRIRLYMQYVFQATDFVNSNAGDFATHTLVAGVRTSYRKIEFDMSAGNRRVISHDVDKLNSLGLVERNQYDSDDGMVANLRITAHPLRRLTAYLLASQEFTAGVLTGGSKDTRVEVGTTLTCFEKGKFDTRALWYHENRGSGLEQTTMEYEGRFTYRVLRSLHAFADINRSERSTNLDNDDVIINRAQVGISFRY